jgi:aspartate aminotransferase
MSILTAPAITAAEAVRRIEAVSRRVQQPASSGDLVSLAVGEPDFTTPAPIVEAAAAALRDGWTHYAPLKGDPQLRFALADQVGTLLGRPANPDHIQVTHGGSAGLASAILGLIDPGDVVVLPDPTYSLYADLIAMAGGRAVHVPLADDLHWDLDALTSALTGARMFVFCNPSNPTGIVHTRAELEALGDALDGTDTLVLTDEAYADLVFTSAPFVSALEVPSLAERTIYCQTFSKSYAMTGWRLGYLWGPPAVIEAAGRVHASFMGSPNTFVQRAGLVALSDCADEVAGMREAYRRRQRLMYDELRVVTGLQVQPPEGAFYLFPRYDAPIGSIELVGYLRSHGVAVRPGAEFGKHGEHHLRLSCAASDEHIITGVHRLADALTQITG